MSALRRTLMRLNALGVLIVATITPTNVDAVLGVMPPTTQQILAKHLAALLNHAIKRDWLRINPMLKVDRISLPQKEVFTLEPSQVTVLMSTVESHPDLIAFHAFVVVRWGSTP